MASKLENAHVIGSENFNSWSQGFDEEGYLKVLPHPDQKILFKDPFQDWKEGLPGNYFSSWGPDEKLEVTLALEDLSEIEIDGFGTLQAGDGIIPWLDDKKTPYENLRGYNGTIPGPMLIVDPGDTLDIQLKNNLTDPEQPTNLHTHGLHVSPVGNGDNVLLDVKSGETWPIEIDIPEDHFIGLDWYHPHLHGLTNEQLSSGASGLLVVNPPHDLPDLDKWNPTERPGYFLGINSFGIQQSDREGSAEDPLNQNINLALPAGTPLEVLKETEDGQNVYELSDAVFNGYNAKPLSYDPLQPTGNREQSLFEYGAGVLAEPVENVIHTVNGQYNPTIEVKTGEWNMFSFANQSVNSFHVMQVVKEEGGELIPKDVTLVGIDGDNSGVVEGIRREIDELPLLNPGSRASIQHWFEEPGTYHVLSNGTEELLGENTAALIEGNKGFNDGHLTWGPQVLATIEVTGEKIPTGEIPEAYDTLTEQSQEIDEVVEAAENGEFDRERTFVWSANAGGAILEGNAPDDTDVSSFEGTYRINGEYFSTTPGESMVPLSMPMLDTTEIWNVRNISGKSDPDAPVDIPLLEWHPFHIHQNDFVVTEINGLPIEDIEQNYLAGVLTDTVALPPTYAPGTVTPENPYGTPQMDGETGEVKILMDFEDFSGSYVNHCHILFHEDAGMMAVVRVILNTDDTWLGLGSKLGDPDGSTVELIKANSFGERVSLTPYGTEFTGGIDVAIADVNYKQEFDNNNVTDNVTDIVTVETSLNETQDSFTVKVFDGQSLKDSQLEGQKEFNELDEEVLTTEFNPFEEIEVSSEQVASVATGDVNGDGYADIAVGIGGGTSPLIEIYSGADYQLLSRIDPFLEEDFDGEINLAVGDTNGDNFDDLIIGQGSGGRGLLEVYDGRSIDSDGSLDGRETAEKTALLSEPFRPYGESYEGEIEVTSGYVLQRPNEPNGKPIQTNNANITTLAVDEVPEGYEQIQVFSYLGGAHHGGEEEHGTEEEISTEIRLDAAFTPETEIEQLSGTFADLPDLPRGEPVLLAGAADGESEIIHLGEGNIPQYFDLASASSAPSPNFGSIEDDVIEVKGLGNSVFGGAEDDTIDAYFSEGDNRIYADSGDDLLILGRGDRLVGGDGNDSFFAGIGGDNKIDGGAGADRFWIATAEIPEAASIINDFEVGIDVIGIAGLKITFDELSLTQAGSNTSIALGTQELAILSGIESNSLTENDFAFV